MRDDSGPPAAGATRFLDELGAPERARFLELADRVTFAFGETIVREGDPADALFVVEEGRVRVVKRGDNGREIQVGSLGPGDVVGEIAILRGETRTATLRASGDVAALRLVRADLERLLAEMPAVRDRLDVFARSRLLQSFLRKSSALGRLPAAVLRELVLGFEAVEVAKGAQLIREGDPPGPMYVVESGRLRVFRGEASGAVTLAYLREGDFVGELSLLVGAPRSATVEAIAPSRVLALGAGRFRELLDRAPEFRRAVEERIASFDSSREARVPLDFAEEILPQQTWQAPAVPSQGEETGAPEAGETADDGDAEPFETAEGHFRRRAPRRRFPFVPQVDEMDCGAACLAMICRWFGRRVSSTRIRALAHVATDGTSLGNICRAAQELGLAARTARVSMRNLEKMPLPAIIHWDGYHWVVLVEVRAAEVRVADPASGVRWLPRTELVEKWSGYAGLFDFTEAFEKTPESAASFDWIRPYFRPYAGTIVRAILLALVASTLTMALPVFTQIVVDRVVVEGATQVLDTVLLAMGATLFFLVVGRLLQGYLMAFVAVRVDAAALDFLTRRLLALPISYFQARRTGDIERRLDGARQVREMLVTSGVSSLLAAVQLVVALLLMAAYSVKLTLVFLAVAPLYALLMVFSARRLKPLFDKLEESYGKYRSERIDAIKGIEAVKASAGESAFRDQLLDRFLGTAQQQFRADLTVLAYQGAIQAVGFLSTLLFLWMGAKLAIAGELTLGGLVAFSSLVAMANAPIVTFLGLWDRLQLAQVLLGRLSDIFEQEPEQGHDRSRLLPVRSMSGAVELRGVGFRFGGPDAPPILSGIDLSVPAGKTVAIVGRSGSGKTTLAKMIAGLLEPTEGTILFDGVELKTLNYRDLRRHVGFVLQENHMFCGTILENIAFGDEPDLERAVAAARAANAHEFIERLPMGYETKVGESGVALSGGQRQRIAIARAIYRRPAVLIFDEATSALDSESERAVQENLGALLAGRTAFVIAHRLSTVRDADRIVVLERGEVVEEGTHDELMDRRGIYFWLVSRQVES